METSLDSETHVKQINITTGCASVTIFNFVYQQRDIIIF